MDALKMAYVPYNLYIKISFLDKFEFLRTNIIKTI